MLRFLLFIALSGFLRVSAGAQEAPQNDLPFGKNDLLSSVEGIQTEIDAVNQAYLNWQSGLTGGRSSSSELSQKYDEALATYELALTEAAEQHPELNTIIQDEIQLINDFGRGRTSAPVKK